MRKTFRRPPRNSGERPPGSPHLPAPILGRSLSPVPAPTSSSAELPGPDRRHRALAALAISLLTAACVLVGMRGPAFPMDFDYVYLGARAVAHGEDPYSAVQRALDARQVDRPLYYPATATTLLAPIGLLPRRVATALFLGLAFGALAFGLSRSGWWRLGILGSAPAVLTILFGQWSVWLLAAVLIPWLSVFWAAKPTIGLALFIGWPSRTAVIAGLVLTLVATVLVGTAWIPDWLNVTRHAGRYYLAPVVRPFGFLLLAAFLAWRRPEGRMLGALAVIPHTSSFPDAIYLLLIARTPRELAWLVALGYLAATILTLHIYHTLDPGSLLSEQWPMLLVCVYLPALGLLLYHAWQDRIAGPGRAGAPSLSTAQFGAVEAGPTADGAVQG